ncbi:MAG: TraM recognition domain-containing protein [Patescibacteria group bacterium]
MSYHLSNIINVLSNVLPIVAIAVVSLIALTVLVWLGLKLYNLLRLYKQDVTYLELTPPAWTDRMPESTGQYFTSMHGLGTQRWLDELLRREYSVALEVVATRSEGIRYLARVPEATVEEVERNIRSYLPDVKIKRTTGYFKGNISKRSKILSFKQAAHFALPLKSYEFLSQQDPMGYITNAMTKLKDGELMAMQLVFTPSYNSEADKLNSQILSNEDLLSKLDKRRAPLRPKIFNVINTIIFGIIDGLGNAYHGSSQQTYYGAEHYSHQRELEHSKQVAKHLKPARTLSYFEQQLVESIHDKLAQPLFKTEIRVLIDCDTKQVIKQRRRSLVSALNLLSVPNYQRLKVQRARFGWLKRYQQFAFTYRLPRLFGSSNLFAASELASLFHFPHSKTAKTENVVKSLSKTLPAPISLKNSTKLDVILGVNQHHGSVTPIGLTAAERERHIYMIGGTGNGKTTMLMGSIVQDMHSGKGLAVVDPHGDLTKTLLEHVPPERMQDVIYFDPDDVDFPVVVNLLELPAGLSGSELEKEKDRVTESVISVFRKIFSEDDSGGHRIEYVLRNAIQTALTLENPTIFTIFELLTNDVYRKSITDNLPNGTLKNFWKNELGKAGNMQRVKMSQGVTSKIGRFEFSIHTKRVMGQAKSTIDFDEILQDSKILICNFSKGRLGEEASALFGTAILAKLQVAANRRDIIPQTERTPFYLYVDEFQNFATMPFVQMLSEARKYRLFLTMAEQSTSQQEEQRMVNIILANVGTVICFRTGSPFDERLMLPLFKPSVEEGEIANLPSFNFYIRISAIQPQEPFSGETVLLDETGSQQTAEQVREQSRENYAIEYKEEKPKQAKQPPAKTETKEDDTTDDDEGYAIETKSNPA